jgi:mitochondrial fission protein ELM1
MTARTCWILSEGIAGHDAQSRGLAQALGVAAQVRKFRVRGLWRHIPPQLWPSAFGAVEVEGGLSAPWPDLVITCGGKGAAVGAAIKAASGGQSRAIHILKPRISPRRLDVVIVPRHDGMSGDNIIVTRTALTPVTGETIAAGARRWRETLGALPRPLVAVLVGGSNDRFRLTPDGSRKLGAELAALARQHGAGLAITTSRRTGAENEAALRAALAGAPAFFWDGQGDNPFFGMLALADAIVVTEDSVSMTSEACATGKPVYIARLDGESRRIRRFHGMLQEDGITRPFTGALEHWHYMPPDDTARAAAEIKRRFGWA